MTSPTTQQATNENSSVEIEKEAPAEAGFDVNNFGEKISVLTQFIAAEPEISAEEKGRLRAQLKMASDKLEGLQTESDSINSSDKSDDDSAIVSSKAEKIPVSLVGRKEVLDFLSAKGTIFNDYAITLSAAGQSQTHLKFGPEIALAPLVFTHKPEAYSQEKSEENRRLTEDLFSLAKIKRYPKLESKAKSILNSFSLFDIASTIKLAGKSVHVAYGNFEDIADLNARLFDASPLMLEYIEDHLSSSVGALNYTQKKQIFHNLKFLTCDSSYCDDAHNSVWYFLASVPDAWPEETVESTGKHLQLLRRFFLNYIAPLLLLDPSMKPLIRSSFLKNELGDKAEIRGLIEEAFIYFVSRYQPITLAIQIYKKQTKFAADLDLNGDGKPKSRSVIVSEFEPITRTESFRVSKDDAELGGEIEAELIGKVMDSKATEKLIALSSRHPHFYDVIEFLEPYVKVSYLTGKPLKFPPLLIAGPPGIGKSKFMDELYDVLGYPRRVLHGSGVTHGAAIAGLQQTWGSAHQGYVAETMLATKLINPLITFDELDKTGAFHGENPSITSALLRVLEPLEAKNFTDAFFNTPHDASMVNWIFTCNQPLVISNALMTRFTTIYVYPPTERSAIDHVHCSIWADQIKRFGAVELVSTVIDNEILDHLAEIYYDELQFRKSYRLLERGLTKILATIKPGQKSVLTLEMILAKKSSNEQKTGIVLH
jgi:hypothetical protein